jgi:DNA invertase Pin-like site-specific DNA recombinase
MADTPVWHLTIRIKNRISVAPRSESMKRAVLYTRVSTFDQNPETQALDLRRLAEQRGFEIVHEYTDRISGAKAKRPALDQMLAAAGCDET